MHAEVRSVSSLEELQDAQALLRALFPHTERGWRGPAFFAERHPAEAALQVVAVVPGRGIVGAALGHRQGDSVTLAGIGLEPDARGAGLGARLLAAFEEGARGLGATSINLGTVDASANFYVRFGYEPALMVQFVEDRPDRERLVEWTLREGPLAGLSCTRGGFRGVPQIFARLSAMDFALKARVEREAPGCVAGFMMAKPLCP